MSIPPGLERVMEKIIWTQQHRDTLDAIFKRYFQTEPAKIVREQEPASNDVFVTITPTAPIPTGISYAIGDCLQNLRSALDYLVRELVLTSNNVPTDHEIFPICKAPKGFKEAVRRGQLGGIHPDAVALIELMQPYNRGQNWEKSALWILNELANTNKHRRLLLTEMRSDHVKLDAFVAGVASRTMALKIPMFSSDTKLGPFPAKIPADQVQMQRQILICITFNERPVEGYEVSETINVLTHHLVADVIPAFEPFFPK
jgi:hypothetical protein